MTHATKFHGALAGLLVASATAAASLVLAGPATAAGPTRTPRTTTTTAPGASAPTSAAPTTRPTPTSNPHGCKTTVFSAGLAKLQTGINARLALLGQDSSDAAGAKYLTTLDRGTLQTDIANETAGIGAIQASVPSLTTCKQLATAGKQVVDNYRVYVVMTPQVHLTIADDTETAIIGLASTDIVPKVQAALTTAKSEGLTVSAAEAAFQTGESQLSSAQNDSAGISAQVLGFTPASYPGCWTSFQQDKSNLAAGETALKKADTDLHTILADLKAAAASAKKS